MFSFLSLKRKFLMGHSRPLFRYFVFSIQLTLGKRKLYINIGSWLDSNRGPIVPKATALPNWATTTTLIRNLLGFKSNSGIEQSKKGSTVEATNQVILPPDWSNIHPRLLGRDVFKPCLRPGYFLLQLSNCILDTWMLLTGARVQYHWWPQVGSAALIKKTGLKS